MSILVRLAILGALVLMDAALLLEASKLANAVTPDPSKVAIMFVLIIFVTVAIGGIVAMSLVPTIGERVGGFFFNPNEKIEKDVHADAIAAVNRGDWEGAIEEFKKVLERDPTDSVSINDIVHLYTDKLEDPETAATYLEGLLENEWPPDHTAFLASRLVDIYWGILKDAERSRHVLIQIAEAMPDTRHCANAQHRLREIDQALSESLVEEPLFLRPSETAGAENSAVGQIEEDGFVAETENDTPPEAEPRQS